MTAASPVPALTAAFERQRLAFAAAPFPLWRDRRDRLRRLKALLVQGGPRIAAAIDADFGGRPAFETELLEVFPSLEELKSALAHGSRWMAPRPAPMSKWFLPARARIVPQPLGVVGIIVPWNYPLFLSVGPLVGALAAGNRALLKLSEFTPAFAETFTALVEERFAPDEVAVIGGDAEVAAAFSRLPFDHLLFTGSTAVGRRVMAAAAEHLTPVTLELGGKSPALIAPGARMQQAAERIMTGKLVNAGQTCIAPDYALVPRADMEAFTQAALAAVRRMYPAGLADDNYCSVINARHFARLKGALDEAQGQGARVVELFDGVQDDVAAHRLAPRLLVAPPATSALMQDEIFGPLLPVIPYDDLAEARAFIAARPRPLALYWFDRDLNRAEAMLRGLHAGGVTINDVLLHIALDSLPFGGVGASGFGHYHGQWGFDTFSKLTPMFVQSRLNALGLFQPPYRPLARRLLALMKRY